MCLNFTLPGYENVELMKGGSNISVDRNNVQHFVDVSGLSELCAG